MLRFCEASRGLEGPLSAVSEKTPKTRPETLLVGTGNRLAVLSNWAWAYITYNPRARLITGLSVSYSAAHQPMPTERELDAA